MFSRCPLAAAAADGDLDLFGGAVDLAAGFDDDDDALPIRAPARVLGATLEVDETLEYVLGQRRQGYLVPASGAVDVNGVRIDARDGAAIKDVGLVRIPALENSEVIMVDAT